MKVLKSSHNFSSFLVVILLVQFGCTGSSPEKEKISSGILPGDEEILTFKNQLELALAKKQSWHSHWKNILGPFDSSSFELAMTDSIDPMEMPERNPILSDDPLYPYQFAHPTGNGTMDIYSYKIEAQEAVNQPFLNPDSEVIWYRADGMKERLLFMGPSGMFEEGEWLSEREFIVFGYFEEQSGFRPMAWIINVQTHKIAHFNFRDIVKTYEPDSYLDKKIKQVFLN
jgi:hypothetical protein